MDNKSQCNFLPGPKVSSRAAEAHLSLVAVLQTQTLLGRDGLVVAVLQIQTLLGRDGLVVAVLQIQIL